jgi:sugar phosphate permease
MSDLPQKLVSWRWRIFAATWLSYFGYYFCRKPYYIAKSTIATDLHFSGEQVGQIGAAYLVAYTIGQFANGALGQRAGARLLLLLGMGLSIAVNIGMGLSGTYLSFVVLMAVNGFAQSSGWSGNVGTMAAWFGQRERGQVMGIWATNFQAGGVAANTMAAWVLHHYGWQSAFFVGSLVLGAIWTFFLLNQRNRPEDLGLPAVEEARGQEAMDDGPMQWTPSLITNMLLAGSFYFFLKFIRYALWSWAPWFLERSFGLKGDDAGYYSTIFDVAGIFGVLFAGWVSDRFFASRRVGICLIMTAGLVLSCVVLLFFGSSLPVFAVCLALVGFTLYGPDALMTGAGAMDIGSRRGAVAVAGVINGMGSLGSVMQELVIGKSSDDIQAVLRLLLGSALGALVVIGIMGWRNRTGRAAV